MNPQSVLIAEIQAAGRLDRRLLALLADAPSQETDALLAWRLLGLDPENAPPPALTSDAAVARARLLRPHEEAVSSVGPGGTWWAMVSVPRFGRRPGAPERDVWRWPDGELAGGRGSTEASAICAAVLAARVCEGALLCEMSEGSAGMAARIDYLGACLRPAGSDRNGSV
jgi:hypothetical protein